MDNNYEIYEYEKALPAVWPIIIQIGYILLILEKIYEDDFHQKCLISAADHFVLQQNLFKLNRRQKYCFPHFLL